MNIKTILKDFDKKFSGLKSNGHKKIHRDNHSAHDGSSCDNMCLYVGISIKQYILTSLLSVLKEQREETNTLMKESEKFVPFQKIHYQSALQDTITSLSSRIEEIEKELKETNSD